MAKPKPIRLGILGLGRAGWGMHGRELEGKERLFQIVAGCDTLKEKRDRFAARHGCPVYRRAEDLVADPNVEMVAVATRSVDHLEHARMALAAGKHVFQEKPITVDYGEAKRLAAAAKRSKGGLFIRHNRRNEPAFLHIREIMVSGILGDVFEVRLMRGGYARRDDWQTLKRFGGGQMLNWGPHIVDHLLRMLDAPIRSMWSDLKRVAAVGDAEDHLRIVATGTNGRVVDMTVSGGAAIMGPDYLIWGTRGALECSGNTITVKYLDPKRKLPSRRPKPGDPGATFGSPEKLPWIEKTFQARPKRMWDIWDELFAAVRQGKRFPVTLEEALEVMKVISAAKRGTAFQTPKRRRKAQGK